MKIGYALFPAFALLAGCAAAPADHYQPLVLNQAAQERAGANDAATARIFALRARRIAGHDPRIGLKASGIKGEETGEGTSPVTEGATGLDGEAPLPALWSPGPEDNGKTN
ncbi:MAG TPA: hypothetical protein VFW68_02095 [Rhodocyclaceae bacterium]|nr:hypothetical protein [Rhodocyclaceae bacterium]